MNSLRHLWEDLRASLWLVPTLLVVVGVGLALLLVEVDTRGVPLAESWPRLFGAGVEGSRGLLEAIAGSMITVAGVTFSITVVTLSLASSQYTSRILRNFMQDRANQTVLGVFVGVFAYCLVVLRTIRGGDDGVFVPRVAVLAGVALAMVAVGFLIFFIHHVANSIQAESILGAVTAETVRAVDRLFPEELGRAAGSSADVFPESEPAGWEWAPVPARTTGFLQGVDADGLLELAREQDTVVRMEKRIGDFVIEGSPLASLAGTRAGERAVDRLNAACIVGRHRTVFQDSAYGVQQIVDVALKALSPGINDTTTAIHCVDHLGAILARLAGRRVETPYRVEGGRLRVITRGTTFPGLLDDAFGPIRRNAEGNVAVLTQLLEILEVVAGRTGDARRRQALRLQAGEIAATAEHSVPSARDRSRVRSAHARLLAACAADGAPAGEPEEPGSGPSAGGEDASSR